MAMTKEMILQQILPAMVLAPSAHNTQPWKFAVSDNAVAIYADQARHLSVSDPTKRQLFLSLGCAAENGLIAAAAAGWDAQLSYFPSGEAEDAPVLRLTFADAGSSDAAGAALFSALSRRRTDRALFDGQPLAASIRAQLPALNNPSVIFVEDNQRKNKLGALAGEGSFATLSRPDFKEELSHWVRGTFSRKLDGMPASAMLIPPIIAPFISLLVKIAPLNKQEQAATGQQIRSASGVVVFVAEKDTPQHWLQTGQALERLWLEATAVGLSAAPLAAAVESGADIRSRTQAALDTPLLPQIMLRIGRSGRKSLKAVPRRPVSQCLIN